MFFATVGSQGAVRLQQVIDPPEDVVFGGSTHQRDQSVVEGSGHVEGRGQAGLAHPEDTKSPIVRQHVAVANLKDVLW